MGWNPFDIPWPECRPGQRSKARRSTPVRHNHLAISPVSSIQVGSGSLIITRLADGGASLGPKRPLRVLDPEERSRGSVVSPVDVARSHRVTFSSG